MGLYCTVLYCTVQVKQLEAGGWRRVGPLPHGGRGARAASLGNTVFIFGTQAVDVMKRLYFLHGADMQVAKTLGKEAS